MSRILLILLALLFIGARTDAAQSPAIPTAQDLLVAVNNYRVSNGKPALEPDSRLMTIAQNHASWQAANRVNSHQGEGGTMPQDRANAVGYPGLVSENAASGTNGYATVDWAVAGWAGSPVHRQAMLSDSVHIGAGVASDAEHTWYVLVVGSPSGAARSRAAATQIPSTADSADESEQAAVPVVVPIVLSTPDEGGSVWHVVQQGQTAWALAARYGVGLDQLLALNGLRQGAILKPGDRVLIRVGEGQTPPPTPTQPVTHVVRAGETLWQIAAQYNTSVDALLALNDLTDGIVRPNEVIVLRTPDPTATPTLTPSATLTFTPTPTAAPPTATPVPTGMPPTETPLPPTLTPTPAPPLISTNTPGGRWFTLIVIGWVGVVLAGIAGAAMFIWRRRKRTIHL